VRTFDRLSLSLLLAAFASSSLARADDLPKPAPLVQIPSEDGSIPNEDNSHPSVAPIVTHPPWNGQGAIWGGVGLVIAGSAALIVALPVACFAAQSNDTSSTCLDAMLGASLGTLALGGVLLIVGETQRASYKNWLRTHPAFAGLSLTPNPHSANLAWTLSF
jgi:hypothetical protein